MFEGFVFRGDRGISGGAKCVRGWARVDSGFSLCGQEIIRIRVRVDNLVNKKLATDNKLKFPDLIRNLYL